IARAPDAILHVHPKEIIIATGAAEIQPVAPGNHLAGICTTRGAEKLAAAGIDMGRTVTIRATDDLVRFEGEARLTPNLLRDAQGNEIRTPCDAAIIDLGRNPRNSLARMAAGLPVRVVGDAALEPDLPRCPRDGTVCPCSGVTVADLESVWERGFHELELV